MVTVKDSSLMGRAAWHDRNSSSSLTMNEKEIPQSDTRVSDHMKSIDINDEINVSIWRKLYAPW